MAAPRNASATPEEPPGRQRSPSPAQAQAEAPDEPDQPKPHPKAAIGAKELLDPSTINRPIMFGQGCEVETVYAAQRYAYAAKLGVANWSKTNPLPRLFALPEDHRLVRSGPKGKGKGKGKGKKTWKGREASHWRQSSWGPDQQELDQRALHFREVMGMIRVREGEFKLWQPKWNRPGPPEAWASSLINTWFEDDPSKSQEPDPQAAQLQRTPGHKFTPAMGDGSVDAPTADPTAFAENTARCTMSVSHWRRRWLIVSLPQFFLIKRDDFSANQLYSMWDESETIIAQKPKRGTSSRHSQQFAAPFNILRG